MDYRLIDVDAKPTEDIDIREVFGIESDMKVKGFYESNDRVPALDPTYKFDPETTLAILAGFQHNRRVIIQGYHGTGKSTHIEQVAARLNWPCVRVNLDSHISRIDLIGKDAIKVEDGVQFTEFQEGILPWALRNPTAIVFDEYDAGRADVMFVIQRVLESDGKLTLLDQNEVIAPAPLFPPLRHGQHRGSGRHDGPLPRHPADQPGPDGPLVAGRHAELSQPRRRMRDHPVESPALQHRKGPPDRQPDGPRRGPHAHGLHQWRSSPP